LLLINAIIMRRRDRYDTIGYDRYDARRLETERMRCVMWEVRVLEDRDMGSGRTGQER
jgi:hypothetical protein